MCNSYDYRAACTLAAVTVAPDGAGGVRCTWSVVRTHAPTSAYGRRGGALTCRMEARKADRAALVAEGRAPGRAWTETRGGWAL